jgi:hypothetical protein
VPVDDGRPPYEALAALAASLRRELADAQAAMAEMRAETLDRQLRQPSELITQRSGPEDQPCRLSPQAAGHESDHLRGSVIKPLLIIDHAQHRLLGRRLREQAQHGKADQEPVRNRPGIQAERDTQRGSLRCRDGRQPVKQRRAQLMQRSERQLHLRLNTGHPDHAAVSGALHQELK